MFGRNPFRITAHISPLTAIWLMIMFIPTTGRAQLESTMPLAVGNSWSYTGTGQNLTLTVAGTATVLGRSTYRLVFRLDQAEACEEYLSWNGQGQLLLHARKEALMPPVVYDPPLVWFTPGAQTGVGGPVRLYADFEKNSLAEESVYYVAFMGDEIIEVPAGTYSTTHVDELNSTGEERWYTAGVGLVQLAFPHGGPTTFVLNSHNLAVAIESSSWSRVKTLYR